MQALVHIKHVLITKTGHLQGHSSATSNNDAGFCMLKKTGTHNKPLCFSEEVEEEGGNEAKLWTI
jgi:hypothetical protein